MSLDLVLRRTDSSFVPAWDRDTFWDVFCEGAYVGSIVEHHGRSDDPATWQWTMHLHAGRFTNGVEPMSGSAPTRDSAMAAFRVAWDIVRPVIGDEGWALHLDHCAWSRAQAERWARQRAGTETGGYG